MHQCRICVHSCITDYKALFCLCQEKAAMSQGTCWIIKKYALWLDRKYHLVEGHLTLYIPLRFSEYSLALGIVQRNKFKTFSSHQDTVVLKLGVQIKAFWCTSVKPRQGRLTAIFSKAHVRTPSLSVTFPLEFLC